MGLGIFIDLRKRFNDVLSVFNSNYGKTSVNLSVIFNIVNITLPRHESCIIG